MMSNYKKQQGAVLVISLFILAVITMFSITGMRTSTIEEKLSANLRDRTVAFQASELGLTAGETFLAGIAGIGAITGTNGLYTAAQPEPDYESAATWTNTQSAANIQLDGAGSVTITPQYIVKHMGETEGPNTVSGNINVIGGGQQIVNDKLQIFKVVSRSRGLSPNAIVTLQTYYTRSAL